MGTSHNTFMNNEHERVNLQIELDIFLGRKQIMIDGGIYVAK